VCHLVWLGCGPVVTLWTLAWGIWQSGSVFQALAGLLVARTPWQALGLLGMVYSVFIWGVYVLPTLLRPAAPGHSKRQRQGMGPAPWQHAGLWAVVFGPLLYHFARTDVLTWPLNGLVMAALVGACYEMVWNTADGGQQQHP
jgi:hypothetical protein